MSVLDDANAELQRLAVDCDGSIGIARLEESGEVYVPLDGIFSAKELLGVASAILDAEQRLLKGGDA